MNQPDREEALKMAREAMRKYLHMGRHDQHAEVIADALIEARALEAERAAKAVERAAALGGWLDERTCRERASKLREQKQP